MEPKRQPNGRWRVRYRDGAGKSREKWFDTRKEGEHFIATMRISKAEGTFVDPRSGDMTLRAWSEEFLRLCRGLAPTTQALYQDEITRVILPVFGSYPIRSLPSDVVENWIFDEIESGLAPSTVDRHWRILKRMLAVAVQKRKLAVNPLRDVNAPRVPTRDMVALTWDQAVMVAEAFPAHLRPFIYTAVDTGMRWGELRGLQRKRIDLATRKIKVIDQLVRVGTTFHRVEPKGKRPRSITISRYTAELLAEQLEQRALPGADGLVFPNSAGNPMHTPNFHRVWKGTTTGLGLVCRFHDLRHTSASLAIAAGAHPKAIQMRLGHASITITLDLYGHLFPDLDDAIADQFSQSVLDARARYQGDRTVVHANFS